MRFRTYILVSAAIFWFILGLLFFYRSFKNTSSYNHKKGALTEYGFKYLDSSHQLKFIAFKLDNSNKTYALKRKFGFDYSVYLDKMNMGDTIELYYNDFRKNKAELFDQIVQMRINNKSVIELKDQVYKDRIIGGILTLIALILFILSWWLNKDQWSFKKKDSNEILYQEIISGK